MRPAVVSLGLPTVHIVVYSDGAIIITPVNYVIKFIELFGRSFCEQNNSQSCKRVFTFLSGNSYELVQGSRVDKILGDDMDQDISVWI